MASVNIASLEKNFGSINILNKISFHVPDGSFVALVGPSGCGKSTLLRTIAGLEHASAGEIYIDGRAVNNLPPKDRDIAMVFQSYALYPHMNVSENMGFSLRLSGATKSTIDQRVRQAAETLHLSALLERLPRELSGGQRQRVAMGRAIVRNPKVFLFDEPLSNLDAKLRVIMRAEIKELHQRLRTTTIYVTHDQIEAMTMADKVVVMNGGHIEQIASPLELYDAPDNLFVAGFIGSPQMNLLSGRFSEDGTFFVSDEGYRLGLPKPVQSAEQKKFVYGIRPEHLTLSDSGIPVRVTIAEPTGSETYIYTKTDKGTELLVVTHERVNARPGEILHLSPQVMKAHIFDFESGKRLS